METVMIFVLGIALGCAVTLTVMRSRAPKTMGSLVMTDNEEDDGITMLLTLEEPAGELAAHRKVQLCVKDLRTRK